METIKVFISYSHDSDEHKQKILDFTMKLIDWGIECELDQFLEGTPIEGWPRWMVNQIEQSDYVIIVNSATYKERFEGKSPEGIGLGGKWEGAIITQQLYDAELNNLKFIPVLLDKRDDTCVPVVLRGATYYNILLDEQFEDLYRYITNQPRIVKPNLGKRKILEVGTNLKKKNDK